MRIAVTGGTGFVGRALIERLATAGHQMNCLRRPSSDVSALSAFGASVTWMEGDLGKIADSSNGDTTAGLLEGCDAVVHSALWRQGEGFRGAEGDVVEFVRVNVLGTLRLIEAARAAGVSRFVFVSTCAVHEQILDDRPLDEAHPLWPLTHYGAHKAAIEKFVHSYGLGQGYGICAIRPTGIYGVARPVEKSKWYRLIEEVVAGRDVTVRGGGKEVGVTDVARGIEVLLNAEHSSVAGQSFACYDRYIAQHTVANLAREISGSESEISGETKTPKHQIETGRIRALGMEFGGESLLRETIAEIVDQIRNQ